MLKGLFRAAFTLIGAVVRYEGAEIGRASCRERV